MALDEPEEVGLVGLLEKLGVRLALEREDAKVAGGVDGVAEDCRDLGPLSDDDQIVGCVCSPLRVS